MGERGRLAMGTYHEQEVVAMFTAQDVAVELHVPCQVSEQWAVTIQHYVVTAVVLGGLVIAQGHETCIAPGCDVEAVQSIGSPTGM